MKFTERKNYKEKLKNINDLGMDWIGANLFAEKFNKAINEYGFITVLDAKDIAEACSLSPDIFEKNIWTEDLIGWNSQLSIEDMFDCRKLDGKIRWCKLNLPEPKELGT